MQDAGEKAVTPPESEGRFVVGWGVWSCAAAAARDAAAAFCFKRRA